jgi:UDP:flavonoid glycosyltransferase YjiC (YdhE family)
MMNPEPRDFLFTTWEGGGNVPPILSIVRRLLARGHRVRVMSDACNRPEVEAAGAEFVPWSAAPSRPDKTAASDVLRDWEVPPERTVAVLRDRIMCGPAMGYAQDAFAALTARPADLLVTSEMLTGAMIAAEATGTRCAMLGANISLFPIPGVPPLGTGLLPPRNAEERRRFDEIVDAVGRMFNEGLPTVNEVRRAFGLAPIANVAEQTQIAERYLLATSAAFDFPADVLPAHVRYVGPELGDPSWATPWRSPWPAGDDRPLVLVAFSTTYQGHDGALRRVVDALGELPVRAVVTLGPALAAGRLPAPANVHVCASAPHGPLMREAAVVVTHAGHGSVVRALAAGAPLLCMPMGRDQNDNAARVTARGAGLTLPPDAPTSEIRAAIGRLLDEDGFRDAAARLGTAIADDAERSTAVAELESLAEPGVLLEAAASG